jgi:hypothetical protein
MWGGGEREGNEAHHHLLFRSRFDRDCVGAAG